MRTSPDSMSSRRKPPHLAGASDQPVEIAQTSHSSAGPWSGGNRGRTASIDTARRSRTAPLRWCAVVAQHRYDGVAWTKVRQKPIAPATLISVSRPGREPSVFQDIEDDRHKPNA